MESPLGSDLARLVRIWRALIDHRLKPLELTQTRAEILHGISAEELEQLIKLIAKLEHNIIELQAKG